MSKITSKYQLTLPRAIAERLGIRPGDNVDWQPLADGARLLPRRTAGAQAPPLERRVELFDQATSRQRARDRATGAPPQPGTGDIATAGERDWTREELYGTRGLNRT